MGQFVPYVKDRLSLFISGDFARLRTNRPRQRESYALIYAVGKGAVMIDSPTGLNAVTRLGMGLYAGDAKRLQDFDGAKAMLGSSVDASFDCDVFDHLVGIVKGLRRDLGRDGIQETD